MSHSVTRDFDDQQHGLPFDAQASLVLDQLQERRGRAGDLSP